MLVPPRADAPPVGNWRGWGKAFLARGPRVAGLDESEALHVSVARPYDGPAVLAGHLAPLAEDVGGRRAKRRDRYLRRAGQTHH